MWVRKIISWTVTSGIWLWGKRKTLFCDPVIINKYSPLPHHYSIIWNQREVAISCIFLLKNFVQHHLGLEQNIYFFPCLKHFFSMILIHRVSRNIRVIINPTHFSFCLGPTTLIYGLTEHKKKKQKEKEAYYLFLPCYLNSFI